MAGVDEHGRPELAPAAGEAGTVLLHGNDQRPPWDTVDWTAGLTGE